MVLAAVSAVAFVDQQQQPLLLNIASQNCQVSPILRTLTLTTTRAADEIHFNQKDLESQPALIICAKLAKLMEFLSWTHRET